MPITQRHLNMLPQEQPSSVPVHALAGAHAGIVDTNVVGAPIAPPQHDRDNSHGTAVTPPTYSIGLDHGGVGGGDGLGLAVDVDDPALLAPSPTSVKGFTSAAAAATEAEAANGKKENRVVRGTAAVGTGAMAIPPIWGAVVADAGRGRDGGRDDDDDCDELRPSSSQKTREEALPYFPQPSRSNGNGRDGGGSPAAAAPSSPSPSRSQKGLGKKDHPLFREAPSSGGRAPPSMALSRTSSSGMSSGGKRHKRKARKKSRGGGGGSNGDFARIMASMRKKTFFRPYMFSSRHSRHHSRGKSDASNSLCSSVKPVPLHFSDRSASVPTPGPAGDISGTVSGAAQSSSPPAAAKLSQSLPPRCQGETAASFVNEAAKRGSLSMSSSTGLQGCGIASGSGGGDAVPVRDEEGEAKEGALCSVEVQRMNSLGAENIILGDGGCAAAAAAAAAETEAEARDSEWIETARTKPSPRPSPSPSPPPPLEVVHSIIITKESRESSSPGDGTAAAAVEARKGLSAGEEAAAAPRNRISGARGVAQHLRSLLYDITFDCGDPPSPRQQQQGQQQRRRRGNSIGGGGGLRASSGLIELFRDGEADKDWHTESDFRGFGFDDVDIFRRSSVKSLGTLTDSCFDGPAAGGDKDSDLGSVATSHKGDEAEDTDDEDEDSLCYDSDPGELKFLRRRHIELLGSSHASWDTSCDIGRTTTHSDESSLSGDDGQEENGSSTFGVHLLSMGSTFDDESSYDAVADLKDDETIRDVFEGARNRKMDVIWHPNVSLSHERFDGHKTPLRCTAWIEMGTPLSPGGAAAAAAPQECPKFRWKPNDALASTRRRRTSAGASDLWGVGQCACSDSTYSVDISDIVLVSSVPDATDRSSHPFAWGRKSFVVRTAPAAQPSSDGLEVGPAEFLFEAASERERDDDVNALKLIMARHGSRRNSPQRIAERESARTMQTKTDYMFVSANIEDVDCEDVFVPPHPSGIDVTKDEVELVMPPDNVRSHTVMKVQQRQYREC